MSEQEIEEVISEDEKKKGGCTGCIGNILKFIGGLLVLGVCSVVLLAVFAEDINNAFEEIVTEMPSTTQNTITEGNVTTNEGRTFTIPGNAYTDGRDTDAAEPLTINRINIWDRPGGDRIKNCHLEHAVPVSLSEASYNTDEERYHFYLSAGGCSGWLPGDFLSNREEGIVGDIFP